MKVIILAVAFLAADAVAEPPIVWIHIVKPATSMAWTQVEGLSAVPRECRSDATLPRACIDRTARRCDVFFAGPRSQVDARAEEELLRICAGWFPEPVLLKRKFSDETYRPNAPAPSVDRAWLVQNAEEVREP
jgi:hypothetical protein